MGISITFNDVSAYDVGALVALYQMLKREDPIKTEIFEYWGFIWDAMEEYLIDYVKDSDDDGRYVDDDIRQLSIKLQELG